MFAVTSINSEIVQLGPVQKDSWLNRHAYYALQKYYDAPYPDPRNRRYQEYLQRHETLHHLLVTTALMQEDGCGLVGDIIQMPREKILFFAQKTCTFHDSTKNTPEPQAEAIVTELERFFTGFGFGFEMNIIGWNRKPPPRIEDIIAARDELRDSESYKNSRKPPYLTLIIDNSCTDRFKDIKQEITHRQTPQRPSYLRLIDYTSSPPLA